MMPINKVLVFPNENVAVFDDNGKQMPEYQAGTWDEMREKILRDKPARVEIEYL